MKYEVSAKPEEMLLDALIRGPSESSGGAVLSKNTQIRSIYTKDGICTVDFNQAFLEKTAEQNFKLNVYSVVNTLCSLEQIDRVYINVDGASVENAPDGIDLSRELTPDMSLVTK